MENKESIKCEKFDIVVIGAGPGGLVISIGASLAGKNVLLIEGKNYGGDCTNYGCIPSKSLIASANSAHLLHTAQEVGLNIPCSDFNSKHALERVRRIVSEVKSHEDATALKNKGVNTISGMASFEDANTLKIVSKDDVRYVSGRRIVIATGSSPMIPPILGLANSPYLTNETIFDLKEIPKTLIVIGAGPIGCELGQAFHRLGSKVCIVEALPVVLTREEPETQELITKQFEKEDISRCLGERIDEVQYKDGRFMLIFRGGRTMEGEQLLVATGRKPNVTKLNLEAAGVEYSEKGIKVDDYGRTNIPHIWAVGDVIGAPFFTHYAEYQARAVLKSLILPFWFKKKTHTHLIPRVTFTDPEVASIGLTEQEAIKQYGSSSLAIYHLPFSSVDRAIASGRTDGFIKIITKKWSSRILGASIAGERAGEMISQISTAMYANIPLRKLTNIIHPYPTYSLAIRQTADLWLAQTIFPSIKKLFKWWS